MAPITMQRDLFNSGATPAPPTSGLFAEVVFDRPLDTAYTYGVPEALREAVAVGKRVQTPFGRGDKQTVGFCVGVTETPPGRAVKLITQVLDDEPLLDENLLRLTRWMADYYLCGWGQVLNAVVPAGAKERAGTRRLAFVEAVPENAVLEPSPALTPKQAAALAQLRSAGKALEFRQLSRAARCGTAPILALISKGLARRTVQRVERLVEEPSETAASP